MQYQKLPSEGKVLFKSNNSSGFFLQKLDSFRKYTFAAHGVYGEEGNYEIRGVWMWRGTDIPQELKDHESFEYMTIKKLDPSNETDKNLITDYWLKISPGEIVDGLPVAEVVHFR
jgi:elongation factor 1-gamma